MPEPLLPPSVTPVAAEFHWTRMKSGFVGEKDVIEPRLTFFTELGRMVHGGEWRTWREGCRVPSGIHRAGGRRIVQVHQRHVRQRVRVEQQRSAGKLHVARVHDRRVDVAGVVVVEPVRRERIRRGLLVDAMAAEKK
jgi:hypothetical protein